MVTEDTENILSDEEKYRGALAQHEEMANAAAILTECGTQNDWQRQAPSFTPQRRNLSMVRGIMMYNSKRVVIPKSMREEHLAIIHRGHPGGNNIEKFIRSKMFWPRIYEDLEKMHKIHT